MRSLAMKEIWLPWTTTSVPSDLSADGVTEALQATPRCTRRANRCASMPNSSRLCTTVTCTHEHQRHWHIRTTAT